MNYQLKNSSILKVLCLCYQNYFICDWWFNFECSEAEGLYSLNDKIAAEREELAAAASNSLSTYSAGPVAPAAPIAPPPAPEAPLAAYEEARCQCHTHFMHIT